MRTVPGKVKKLDVSLSTILGVLMWEFSSHQSGGYPIKSFTAEFRRYIDIDVSNETERKWQRLDPHNIPANVVKSIFPCYNSFAFDSFLMKYNFILTFSLQRYFEVFHLIPNTTYEFRLWANNYLGPGEISYTFATTLCQLTDQGK